MTQESKEAAPAAGLTDTVQANPVPAIADQSSTSKMKALFQLGSVLSAVFGLRAAFREARSNNDKLVLADAVITLFGVITGTALALRALRGKEAEK